ALRPEEADGQLRLVTRRPHGDRDGDRVLARTGRPDLERRLPDDPVVADLEGIAPDRHDPVAGDVAGRRAGGAVAGQARHVVASSASPNAVRASFATLAASSAVPSAGSPPSPPPVAAQSTNRSAAVPYAASIDSAAPCAAA